MTHNLIVGQSMQGTERRELELWRCRLQTCAIAAVAEMYLVLFLLPQHKATVCVGTLVVAVAVFVVLMYGRRVFFCFPYLKATPDLAFESEL